MSTYMKFPEAEQSKKDTIDSPNSPQSKLHWFKFVVSAVRLYIQNGVVHSARPCYCRELGPTAEWLDQP